MKIAAVLLGFVLLLPSQALAQTPVVHPFNGIDPARLVRIDSVLQGHVDTQRIAGAVALVMRDGEIVYERAFGWSDREARTPMTTDAIFRIASQSKAVVSVATMMLVEEGKMNLLDPITRWMPTFADATVSTVTDSGRVNLPLRRAITVRDLLTHTSGIGYGGLPGTEGYGWYTADRDEPICATMDKLGSVPLTQQPGAAWVYGYNADILGCIIERVSGVPLDVFLKERLTGPLGMVDTEFYLRPDQRGRLTTVYTHDAEMRAQRSADDARGQGHYVEGPRVSFSGGAGLLSTARDYARFLEMLRRGGELDGTRYLAPHTVAVMTTNHVGALHGDGLGFGLGFETVERLGAGGFSSVGAFGWSGAYGTLYEVDPAERLVLVMMIQLLPYVERTVRESFETAVYQAIVSPVPW